MSGFGGGSNFGGGGSNFNNNQGRGGGGGSNYRGGGGRSSGRRGGRSDGRGRGRGRGGPSAPHGGGGDNIASQAKYRPCKNWTTTGACPNPNCNFAHVVKLHASLDAANPQQQQQQQQNANSNYNQNNYNQNYNNNNQKQLEAVTAVAIWEQAGNIKIFTGSHDGFWRLWNAVGGTFVKEFEQAMFGKVDCLKVAFNYLFCGFETIVTALPDVPVGCVHAWNLGNPAQPPMELQMVPGILPYAHGQAVTQVLITGDETSGQPPKVVSGSRDGSIRVWSFDATGAFVLEKSLLGHAREVTGLAAVNANLLWTAGMDQSIRIWDPVSEKCQHAITAGNRDGAATNSGGHSNAVTALLKFEMPNNGGTFILSSSLDGTVQAWNGTTGQCVANEAHGEGVVCMSMGTDLNGNPLLLIGLESGNIMVRNILQSGNMQAFGLLFCLSGKYAAGHYGAVRSLCQGPSSTFYSCGNDGKLLVWQMTGDLGL